MQQARHQPYKRSIPSWLGWGILRSIKNTLSNRFFWMFVFMSGGMTIGMNVAMHMTPSVIGILSGLGGLALTGFFVAAYQTFRVDFPMQKLIDQRNGDTAGIRGAKYNLGILNKALDKKRSHHGNIWMITFHVIAMGGLGYGIGIAAMKGMSWPGTVMGWGMWIAVAAWAIYETCKVLPVVSKAITHVMDPNLARNLASSTAATSILKIKETANKRIVLDTELKGAFVLNIGSHSFQASNGSLMDNGEGTAGKTTAPPSTWSKICAKLGGKKPPRTYGHGTTGRDAPVATIGTEHSTTNAQRTQLADAAAKRAKNGGRQPYPASQMSPKPPLPEKRKLAFVTNAMKKKRQAKAAKNAAAADNRRAAEANAAKGAPTP